MIIQFFIEKIQLIPFPMYVKKSLNCFRKLINYIEKGICLIGYRIKLLIFSICMSHFFDSLEMENEIPKSIYVA